MRLETIDVTQLTLDARRQDRFQADALASACSRSQDNRSQDKVNAIPNLKGGAFSLSFHPNKIKFYPLKKSIDF